MRGGGMEDVIFAGTDARPARDFAEVVLLADVSGVAGGDNDREMEVVRRIERGAGSAYRVNGRDVRAKDVSLVFADAATGAHSPALVSQGRIAAVIAAKPSFSSGSSRWPTSMLRLMVVVGVSSFTVPSTFTPLPSSVRQMVGKVMVGFSPAGGCMLRSK